MIASDIDGTLLDYNYIPGAMPAVNWRVIRGIARRTDMLTLVTNQGGLPWGVMGSKRQDGRCYPTPVDFVGRFTHLTGALALGGVQVVALHVCVHHPNAPADAVMQAAEALKQQLAQLTAGRFLPFSVYADEQHRKPSPAMLSLASAAIYYGDSDEDAQAAEAAGIEFVRVERFFGK